MCLRPSNANDQDLGSALGERGRETDPLDIAKYSPSEVERFSLNHQELCNVYNMYVYIYLYIYI